MQKTLKERIPYEIMYQLLEKICIIESNHYIININSYKVMLYHKYHEEFLRTIQPYYVNSRAYYVTDEFTYNRFITIIRQICKCNNINYIYDKKNHDCVSKKLYRIALAPEPTVPLNNTCI